MAVEDFYPAQVAVDPVAETLIADAPVQVFATSDLSRENPLRVYEPASGVEILNLRSNRFGIVQQVRVEGDPAEVVFKSGPYEVQAQSKFGVLLQFGLTPESIAAAISAASTATTAAGDATTAAGDAAAARDELVTIANDLVEEGIGEAITAADIPGKVEQAVVDLDVPVSSDFDPELGNDEAFLGDENGNASKVGFDRDGEIAEATMRSAVGKGMARAETRPGDGIAIADEAGNGSWLQAGSDGLPNKVARWAIANTIRQYTGPDRPYVYPGNFIHWTKTDASGEILDILKVSNP